MATTTSRLALSQPVGADPVSELRTAIGGNATTLDNAAIYASGTLASRPSAASVVNGYVYVCTDAPAVFVTNAGAWQFLPINAGAPPVGTVQQFAGATVAADADGVTRWRICDGSAISRTTYATLFAAIGTTWGIGDGSTTFNIPDLRGRVPVGAGTGAGLTSRTLASEGGEESHVLSVAELASHAHGVNDPGHSHLLQGNVPISQDVWVGIDATGGTSLAVPITNSASEVHNSDQTTSGGTGISVASSGSGTAHNNMQPFAALNHIIKIA